MVVAHIFQTLIQVFVVLIVFLLTDFSASCCISSPEISRNLAPIFCKQKNKDARLCCRHGYFVITSFFVCYTSITQKYHHYQPIKSQKFLALYYKCNCTTTWKISAIVIGYRAVVFQLNLKYLHVIITKPLRVK